MGIHEVTLAAAIGIVVLAFAVLRRQATPRTATRLTTRSVGRHSERRIQRHAADLIAELEQYLDRAA